MLVGTTSYNYETIGSPEGYVEIKGTPIELTSTVGVLIVPKDRVVSNDYILQVDLIAEVKFEDDKYVVIDYRVDEYGIGNSLQEAERDLLDSLIDYLESLEKRENRLGDRELHNLQILRTILVK